jgi:ABC-type nickel/cobalt efflux system permease component RcnA
MKDLTLLYLGLLMAGLGFCLLYPQDWLFILCLFIVIGVGCTMLYALLKAVREEHKRDKQFKREVNRLTRKDTS